MSKAPITPRSYPPLASMSFARAAIDLRRLTNSRQPTEFYRPSPRPFVEPVGDLDYGPDEQVRRVRSSGEIRWCGSLLFVSEAITGETVAIRQRPDGHWLIRFADVALGLIDRSSGKLVRLGAARPPRSQAAAQT
ncbi:hypothetical protein [Reyranella sp.]|uniref:hypothetical protein n=1 Tax=Reyranella sp. TaxID=1929291 RepID=UPI002730E118|nr:hypothetical protein [Reyranella sp.]MDP2372353.1 hypothetical protein [Reyranella sp.]